MRYKPKRFGNHITITKKETDHIQPVGFVRDGKYSKRVQKYGGIGQALADTPGSIVWMDFVDRKTGKVQTVKCLKFYDPISKKVALEVLPTFVAQQ